MIKNYSAHKQGECLLPGRRAHPKGNEDTPQKQDQYVHYQSHNGHPFFGIPFCQSHYSKDKTDQRDEQQDNDQNTHSINIGCYLLDINRHGFRKRYLINIDRKKYVK